MSTTPAQQRAADSSISAFGTSLVFNGSVVIVCYLAFGLLRTWRKNVYSPRTYFVKEEKRSSEIPKGIFAWIKPVIGVPDDVLLEKVGIDHYLFIRFFRMCFFLFSAFAVVALLLLVPLNAVAEDNSPGLKLITFGNVLDTNRLWAHSLLTIIFSVTVLYALRREFIVFIRLRQDYQQHHATAPHSRIVLVRDVPPHLNNPRLLRKLFSIFPGGVERVYVSRDPGDLPRLVNLRNRTLQRLETVEAQYVRSYDDVGRAKGGRLRETVAKVTGRGQFHTHQNHAPPKALIRLHELAEMSNFDLTAEEAAKGMTEEKKPVEMETEEKASEANEERVEVVQVGSRFMRESGATSKKFGTVGSWAGTFFKAPDAVAEPAEELGHSSSQYSSLPPPVPPKDLSLPVPAAAPSTIRRTRSGTIRTFTTSPFNTIRSFTRSLAPTNTTNNPAAAATQQAPHTHPPISLAHLPPRPTTLPHGRIPYVPAGAPVDAIKYHRARFLEINRMIKERQARARVVEDEEDKEGEGEGEGEARGVDKKEYKKIGVAFILFKTQMGAQTARQSVIYHGNAARMGERYVEVVPTDVIWANLRIGWQSRVVRKYIGLVASIVLVVFWGLIVAFITSIATLSNLLKILPFLQHAVELSPVITGIIEGLIPAAMLSGLMMLLPLILIYICRFEAIPLYSRIEAAVQGRYFFFLIVNVLLVVTVAGTIFSSIQLVINNPTDTILILATSLPTVSTFFINYLLLQGLIGSAIELTQAYRLLWNIVIVRWFAKTPRQLFIENHPRAVHWGTAFPQQCLVFSIAMVFSTIAPLVLVFAAAYFGLFYLVYRYQLLYVYTTGLQTAGLFFHRALWHCFTGLLIQQLTMVGLFLLRQAWGQGVICIVLFCLTIFAMYYGSRSYNPLTLSVPITHIDLEAQGNIFTGNAHNRGDSESEEDVVDDQKIITAQDDALFKELTDSVDPHDTDVAAFMPSLFQSWDRPKRGPRQHRRSSLSSLPPQLPPLAIHRAQRPSRLLTTLYTHPVLSTRSPKVWLPRDDFGIAENEVEEMREVGIDSVVDADKHGISADVAERRRNEIGMEVEKVDASVGFPQALGQGGLDWFKTVH